MKQVIVVMLLLLRGSAVYAGNLESERESSEASAVRMSDKGMVEIGVSKFNGRFASGAGSIVTAPQQSPVPTVSTDTQPGLYVKGRLVPASNWAKHRLSLDRLIERFLAEVNPPFLLPAGYRIVSGRDDLAYDDVRCDESEFILTPEQRERWDAWFPVPSRHEALDLGSRISADGGRTFRTLGSADAYRIHPGGDITLTIITDDIAIVHQRITITEEATTLVIDLEYDHLKAIGPSLLGPNDPLGQLSGNDRWLSADPVFSMMSPYKGNHIHLIVRGINDLGLRHFVELARPGPRDEVLMEYIRYRVEFLNEKLLPRLQASR